METIEPSQLSNRERIEKAFTFDPHHHLMNIRRHYDLDWELYQELSNLISDTYIISFNKGMVSSREINSDSDYFESHYNDDRLSTFAEPHHKHR